MSEWSFQDRHPAKTKSVLHKNYFMRGCVGAFKWEVHDNNEHIYSVQRVLISIPLVKQMSFWLFPCVRGKNQCIIHSGWQTIAGDWTAELLAPNAVLILGTDSVAVSATTGAICQRHLLNFFISRYCCYSFFCNLGILLERDYVTFGSLLSQFRL